MRHDPELLKRRMRVGRAAEKETNQNNIQIVASIIFIATFIISALDHKNGWSRISHFCVAAGDGLLLLSFAIIFFFLEKTPSRQE